MEVQLKDGVIWTISNKITDGVGILEASLLLGQQVRKCWLIIRLYDLEDENNNNNNKSATGNTVN